MTEIAATLSDITILDDQERTVAVGTAWQEQPALLVFIRHFG